MTGEVTFLSLCVCCSTQASPSLSVCCSTQEAASSLHVAVFEADGQRSPVLVCSGGAPIMVSYGFFHS
jgi:hypothetical protein